MPNEAAAALAIDLVVQAVPDGAATALAVDLTLQTVPDEAAAALGQEQHGWISVNISECERSIMGESLRTFVEWVLFLPEFTSPPQWDCVSCF